MCDVKKELEFLKYRVNDYQSRLEDMNDSLEEVNDAIEEVTSSIEKLQEDQVAMAEQLLKIRSSESKGMHYHPHPDGTYYGLTENCHFCIEDSKKVNKCHCCEDHNKRDY